MLTRSLVTGTAAIVGFLVLVATTELFWFGPPSGAHNAGEMDPPRHILVDYSLIRRQSDAAPRLRPPVRLRSTA